MQKREKNADSQIKFLRVKHKPATTNNLKPHIKTRLGCKPWTNNYY